MSVALPKFKDSVVRDAMGEYPTAPFGWFMMAGYAYYCKQKPIISDACFTDLEAYIMTNWDNIRHPHKHFFKKEQVLRGSALVDFSSIPYLQKMAANGHITAVYANVKPENSVPQAVTPKTSSVPSSHNKDTAKFYFSTAITLDRSLVDDIKTEDLSAITDLAKKHGHSYYGSTTVYGTDTSRARILGRMMALIIDLQTQGIGVKRYTMTETLMDSTRSDVWNILKK